MTLDERNKIREESGCADTTIRCYPNVREASRMRIERAARKLGIELHPGVALRADVSEAKRG